MWSLAQKITPFLWFDDQAEAAAALYTSVFPNAKTVHVAHYGRAGPRPEGSVMSVTVELAGSQLILFNGGPEFTFTPAISLFVQCGAQEEVDVLWDRLSAGGEQGPCGWLKDRFGVSWQIVPARLDELIESGDPQSSARAMREMMTMQKLDLRRLEAAAVGSR